MKFIQKFVGKFLLYGRTVDPTLLVALGNIAEEQTKEKMFTLQAFKKLLDYCATHTNAKLRYRASNMVLRIYSNVTYLSETTGISRAGGFFLLVLNKYNDTAKINGSILTMSVILKNAMALSEEAEVGGGRRQISQDTRGRTNHNNVGVD